jgi:hypothetical protein
MSTPFLAAFVVAIFLLGVLAIGVGPGKQRERIALVGYAIGLVGLAWSFLT